jgi:hypothetical protein
MSLLSRLFGGGGAPKSSLDPEEYKGFVITPTPIREGSRYRVSAVIEKEVGGEQKSHTLIRADVLDTIDDAQKASVGKARQMIDEQGDRLFD